jgi:type IV pilus assembly protein PilO
MKLGRLMAKISEMSKGAQIGVLVLIAILVSAGLYLGFFKRLSDQNAADSRKLEARRKEVQELRKFENDLPRLNQQIATLKEQLEIQKRIVPDEKDADQFIHLLQSTAQGAGIEIRRWTAKDAVTREYYTEVPFDLELDGPYYSVVNFFSRVAKLERIINVGNLQLASLKAKDSKRRGYQYAPQESVVGNCTATTFFTRDPMLVPPTPPASQKTAKAGKGGKR